MASAARGLFVSFEGGDGVGKSTQIARLADRLRAIGREVVATREPGGTAGAERIRDLLLNGDESDWSAMTEVLLVCAARRDHLEKTIRPALDAGAVVLCDRFHDSTEVYQSYARGEIDSALARRIHDLTVERLPDLTLVLMLDPEQADARWRKRGSGENRYERFGEEFQRRVHRGFRELCAREPVRCRAVDASGDEQAVAAAVWAAVEPRLSGECA